ncbi:MAG: hypothetical protein RMN52_08465 [Anaerolineae bacterium]|nr:hypothetical protein [Candidatus Roseilinea sp.]MDW8450023.1 hypothetical protein [Anaerolineae bacterium]
MSATLVTIPARFDGEQIRLDVPYPLEPNTVLLVTILDKPITSSQAQRPAAFMDDFLSLRGIFDGDAGFDDATRYLERAWQSWNPSDFA